MFRFLFIIIALIFYACDSFEPNHENLLGEPQREEDMGEEEPFNFAHIQEKVLEPHCVVCHKEPQGAAGLELENYEEVFAQREVIFEAVDSFFMPDTVGGEMPDSDRELLLKWIELGAPL